VTILRSAAPVQPLTLTVEQTAIVLGVARSTAYELVRSGEIKSIRLRRRIVVPVAHLAERLGVTAAEVWAVVRSERSTPPIWATGARAASPATPLAKAQDPTLF
jgi:excisionase family DNA binding protein